MINCIYIIYLLRYNYVKSKGPITKLSNQDKYVLNGYLNQWQTQINTLLCMYKFYYIKFILNFINIKIC